MFERYTDPAKRVLFFARYEASEFGSLSIEPEHLLLGVLREPGTIVQTILSTPTAALDSILTETKRRMTVREKVPTSVEIPFSRPAQVALMMAAEEADRLLDEKIRPAHVLLGLLREEGTVAASVLHAHGVRLDDVRQRVGQLVEAASPSRLEDLQPVLEKLMPLVMQLAETKDATERQAIRAEIDAVLDDV